MLALPRQRSFRRWLPFALLAAIGGHGTPSANAMRSEAPRAAPTPAVAGITFRDVSDAAGIADLGISFGASAGDFDGDGWPDIFTGGHYNGHARLWHNNQNGTFTDIAPTMVPFPRGDLHGSQWVDLDGDGTQELVLMVGANFGLGASPKYVYRQVGNQFTDVAAAIGLDVALMRARTPLAADYDGDGTLDLFLTALRRPDGLQPANLFLQQSGVFSPFGGGIGLSLQDTLFGVLGDLDGDHRVDALFHGFPARAFRLGAAPAVEITGSVGVPTIPTMNDAVIADFDNDGENEIYYTCDDGRSAFHRDGPYTLEFHAIVDGTEHGVRFALPPGHFAFLDWAAWQSNDIYLGAQGLHPSPYAALLDPTDPTAVGIAPHTPGASRGLYVGYQPATGEWTITCSSPAWVEGFFRVIASQPIGVPQAVGFNPNAPQPGDALFARSNGVYVNRSAQAGIPPTLHGRSVVAVDFDNDMDLDLYVVTTTSSQNTPNVLLENLGGGVFAPVAAGAAAGSSAGVGDAVIALDYDRDGLVDLFLVNGAGLSFRGNGSPGAFADDGPAQLLRNVTKNNHGWLDVELIGTTSNRDGIGARIEVTAGGVRQVRENGGGMHCFSQNHGLHFGLAGNQTADVRVFWPSGKQSVLAGVACNQRLTVVE